MKKQSNAAKAKESDLPAIPGRFCNLMNDVAFQWVFGRESNKDLLIALLNEFIPGRRISDLSFNKQRQVPFSREFKKSVFDVSCKTSDGSYIDVEVQVCGQEHFEDRLLYYSTFNIQGQIAEGASDYGLRPAYVVSIDSFALRHGPESGVRMLYSYSLREDLSHEMLTDALHIVFVELKHFKKKWEDIDNDKERFYFCLKHLHELSDLPDGFAEGIWAKLARQSEFAEMPVNVKKEYIRKMTTEIDKRAQIATARREGIEEGLQQGIEQTRIENARNFKSAGVSTEIICQCTGLTPEQVSAL